MPKPTLESVLNEVEWIQREMRLVRWDPKDYSRLFGRRSIEEILESRQVNYMNSCLDLTTAFIFRLRQQKLDPRLVIQELTGPHTGKTAFHFATEVKIGLEWHTIDFKTGKSALVYPGKYAPEKSNPANRHLNLQRFYTRAFGPKTNFFQLLGISGWRQIGKKFPFMRYSHVRAAAKAMKAADSETLFSKIKRIRPSIRRLH